jgi:hypothetical protein
LKARGHALPGNDESALVDEIVRRVGIQRSFLRAAAKLAAGAARPVAAHSENGFTDQNKRDLMDQGRFKREEEERFNGERERYLPELTAQFVPHCVCIGASRDARCGGT